MASGGPIYAGGLPFFKGGIRTKFKVVTGSAATVTLTKGQSNTIFAFDQASSGISYTLPAPVKGLIFRFITTVAQTSGACEVVTDAATTFLVGSVMVFSGEKVTPAVNVGPYQCNADGTSIVEFTMNGTTQGGGIGSWVEFIAISTTQWYVWGVVNSPSGNIATPFTT